MAMLPAAIRGRGWARRFEHAKARRLHALNGLRGIGDAIAEMIDKAVVALQQLVDRRRFLAGPDHLDIGHHVVVAHGDVHALQRIERDRARAIAERFQKERGSLRRSHRKPKMVEFQAERIHSARI